MRNACVLFAAGGVGTPGWMATGRTWRAPGARAIRAPENSADDGVRAGRRASGVGSAAGAAGPTGERAAENTVGGRLPSARLSGADGVGLPRASGSGAARFVAGGVGDRASGWRLAAVGVCTAWGPRWRLEASPMRM